MLWRQDNKITTGYLLVGLIEQGRGTAMTILRKRGLDRGMLRHHVAIELNRRRADGFGD